MKEALALKQICEISNSKSTKPPPEMSLGISWNEKTWPSEDFRQKLRRGPSNV